MTWTELDAALRVGWIEGSSGQLRLLRASASIADGQPVDLSNVASGLDRHHLRMLAALTHAGGSHEHRAIDANGLPGDPLPPLVSWPPRD